jgi:hypothetical protein
VFFVSLGSEGVQSRTAHQKISLSRSAATFGRFGAWSTSPLFRPACVAILCRSDSCGIAIRVGGQPDFGRQSPPAGQLVLHAVRVFEGINSRPSGSNYQCTYYIGKRKRLNMAPISPTLKTSVCTKRSTRTYPIVICIFLRIPRTTIVKRCIFTPFKSF